MTKQKYYNLLVESANNGVFPSISYNRQRCFYRQDKTASCYSRCTLGLLINDADYKPIMEESSVDKLIESGTIKIPDGMTINELITIRGIHDNIAWIDPRCFATNFLQKLNKERLFIDT